MGVHPLLSIVLDPVAAWRELQFLVASGCTPELAEIILA